MPPILPKDAVDAAYKYLLDIAKGTNISNPRVEQVELIEENKFWLVVLSYETSGMSPFDIKKEYKEFKINSENGTVIYMRIKNLS